MACNQKLEMRPGLDQAVNLCDDRYMDIDTFASARGEPVDRLWDQMMVLVRRLRREGLADSESWTRLSLLSAIDRLGDQASPGALSRHLEARSSNVAAALRDAEERTYIERVFDETDRRRVRLILTDIGRTALQTARAQRTRWLATAIAQELCEEERTTLFAAGELLERLASSSARTSPKQ